jgi:tetratricopeptide (TPR) repeat protein
MKRAAIAMSLFLLCARGASAQDANAVEQAKALFNAGAAAYERHDYAGAIRAFEGAEQKAPRPAIVFSLAQAHRRQFYVDGNAAHQKTAIELFKQYAKDVPSGGRHEDAMRALQELGALSPQQEVASVSVNASGTPNARIALDGAPSVEAPLIGPVTPTKHHVVVTADGFVTEERDITAVNGQIVALDVTLKEKPAVVTIAAPGGAAVQVDGRPVGETPLLAPLQLGSGAHLITLAKNGHDAFSSELDLARGESRTLTAPLPTTKQRSIAIGMLVSSGIVALGGGVCAGFAAGFFNAAQSINSKIGKVNITADDASSYATYKDLRLAMLYASGISFATAAVLAATGLVLYVFDSPVPSAPRTERGPKPTEHKTEPTEISIVPTIGPNAFGASALLRF